MTPDVKTTTGNDYFALIEGPHPNKQHPNQQAGLDMYVCVLNLGTGEHCHKKLYSHPKRGLHFKHTGLPVSFLSEMDKVITYVEFAYEVEDGKEIS